MIGVSFRPRFLFAPSYLSWLASAWRSSSAQPEGRPVFAVMRRRPELIDESTSAVHGHLLLSIVGADWCNSAATTLRYLSIPQIDTGEVKRRNIRVSTLCKLSLEFSLCNHSPLTDRSCLQVRSLRSLQHNQRPTDCYG